ncbi:MAG: hypothetical protein IH830_13475 [Planctomycetes bacterium]|nr:hypothetical protein [Planctomycetota bacterium]
MSNTHRKRHGKAEMKPTPESDAAIVKLPADPETNAVARQVFHGPVAAGLIYRQQLDGIISDEVLNATAVEFANDVCERMKPRDPLEEMLVMQCLWTHTRLAYLSKLANQQVRLEAVKVVHGCCDQASNTFRRLMLALAEYRRPPKGDSFLAIRQANVAQQQIVNNPKSEDSKAENATNELGLSDGQPEAKKALPPHAGRIDPLASLDRTGEAVAAQHRAEDG